MLQRLSVPSGSNIIKKCLLVSNSAVIKDNRLVYVEPDIDSFYLGTYDDVAYYCKSTTEQTRERDFMFLKGIELELAVVAKSLMNFHDLIQFCACCGNKVNSEALFDGFKKVCTNTKCITHTKTINISHPRVDPVVIVMINYKSKFLLGRKSTFPTGFYSLVSGFIDLGESVETAVKRECLEETGYSVENVKYVSSQAWPFPSQLMIGCTAECVDMNQKQRDDELEDLKWVSYEQLKDALNQTGNFKVPPTGSISNFMMQHALREAKL